MIGLCNVLDLMVLWSCLVRLGEGRTFAGVFGRVRGRCESFERDGVVAMKL